MHENIGKEIGEKLVSILGVTVFHHVQRGGSPTAEDRAKASMLGGKSCFSTSQWSV